MQFKKFITKTAAGILSAALVALFGTAEYYSSHLPDHVTTESANVEFAAFPKLTADYISDSRASVSLLGTIPVKSVSVSREEPPTLIAGGKPFGIKLLMEGVMVTGMGDVECSSGKVCPAKKAGIEAGDVIRLANGHIITSNNDLQQIIDSSSGKPVSLEITRGGTEFNADLIPVYSEKSKKWQGGMWVRDSIAGIGTMTFIDKATGQFAGLGHPVCDTDTGELIPLHSGEAVPVRITETRQGRSGIPGELHGQFTGLPVYGSLSKNNECGVYGCLTELSADQFEKESEEFKMGYRQDVTVGEAYILTTVSGSKPKKYSVEIEQVDYSSREASKNMVIRITDEELISSAGGIVQGMSGSPIIQNDRLVGAVTHVFVADPTRGYGIFAENMFENLS